MSRYDPSHTTPLRRSPIRMRHQDSVAEKRGRFFFGSVVFVTVALVVGVQFLM